MRSGYAVYFKLSDPGRFVLHDRVFDSFREARIHTTYGDAGDWQATPNGSFRLSDVTLAEMGRDSPWLIAPVDVPESLEDRVKLALDVALNYGQIDGDHHKLWVIDQIVRHLTGDDYDCVIKEAKAGEEGPDTYSWGEGVAP